MPTKETYDLTLLCWHVIKEEKRPNPRKMWPDPQMCPECKRKQPVIEIRSPRVEVSRLTAPNAPKKYVSKLKKKSK